jgi:transcriptional regulator with XRE-family HTH domain
MGRSTLTTKQAQELAGIFRRGREAQRLSTRQLAAKAGVSHGTVNQLENAGNLAPRPDILRAIAGALELPLSDLLILTDWLPADELPSLQPYLRAKYGLGKRDAAEIDDYLTRLKARHGGGSPGPLDREDET